MIIRTLWLTVIFGEDHDLTGGIAHGPSPELPCQRFG
jgi:hypothetical protein